MTKQTNARKLTSNSLCRISAVVSLGMIVSAGVTSARAEDFLSASASAALFDVDLDVDGTPVKFTQSPVSGSASSDSSPHFSASSSVSSPFDMTLGPLTIAATGEMESGASGGVDHGLDFSFSLGSSFFLGNLDLTLGSILHFTAGLLQSRLDAQLRGTLIDGFEDQNLTLTVLGSTIIIPDKAPQNDVVFDDDGVKITLNQVTLDPTGNPGGTLNGLAIELTRPGLTGNIDVTQSFANVSFFTLPPPAVPEPSTWAMMLDGFRRSWLCGVSQGRR